MVTIVLDSSFDLSLYATVWSVFRSVEICRLQGVLSAYTMVSKELFMLAACSGSCWHLKLHCVGSLQMFILHFFCNIVSHSYAGALGCVRD